MSNLQHLYTITPLDTEHIDEICEDIRRQVETGVATCALFSMTLVPEGNPVVDKATALCEKYKLFKEKLDSMGIKNGVLIQATIGHPGRVLAAPTPFQMYVNFSDGEKNSVVCPYDDGFKDYVYKAVQTIASQNPHHIMLDDDFRLLHQAGMGCACPTHMNRFNELAGTSLTREELWEIVCSDTEQAKKYTEIFVETQREALVETAKVIRAGIDSINPSLPGSFCCVGDRAENGMEIAEIMAGEGNPVIVRINSSNYTQSSRGCSLRFLWIACQVAKLKNADVILAETDTCPQNRYSTSAMILHNHFVGSILEGLAGAKHWITRMVCHEPQSGVAYRKTLSYYSGFYKALAEIVPTLKWKGLKIPVPSRAEYDFPNLFGGCSSWGECVFERLGLPMYFSAEKGGVVCLDKNADKMFTDEELKEVLSGPVFVASDSAESIIKRGFGKYLGVDVRQWQGKPANFEILNNGGRTPVQVQRKELVPLSEDTIPLSWVCNSIGYEKLFPGVTMYKNELGGIIVVFCGVPMARFDISEAFAFLSYSRKQQLIGILEQTDELVAYYPGDEEVYFRTAEMTDGGLFCALFNIGSDPITGTEIVCSRKVEKIQRLMPDGTFEDVSFAYTDGKYTLDTNCYHAEPAIFILK